MLNQYLLGVENLGLIRLVASIPSLTPKQNLFKKGEYVYD